MQALKVLVIVMGVLIVAGLILVAYGLVGRESRDDTRAGAFGEVALDLPAGCEIAAARADGTRLIVRLAGPRERGCQQVIVVDLGDGRVLGRVRGE